MSFHRADTPIFTTIRQKRNNFDEIHIKFDISDGVIIGNGSERDIYSIIRLIENGNVSTKCANKIQYRKTCTYKKIKSKIQ